MLKNSLEVKVGKPYINRDQNIKPRCKSKIWRWGAAWVKQGTPAQFKNIVSTTKAYLIKSAKI